MSFVSFSTGNGDNLTGLQLFCPRFGSDNGRKAQFATDDGGMTRSSATIRHDRGRLLHGWLPVRISLVRDQNLTRAKFCQVAGMRDHMDWPLTDSLTDTATADQDGPSLFQRINLLNVPFLL